MSWEQRLADWIAVDHVFHIFPIPQDMKYLYDRAVPKELTAKEKYHRAGAFDTHTYASAASGLEKEIDFHRHFRGWNIGASCTDLVVVDLDIKPTTVGGVTKPQDGFKTWKKWCATFGVETTWVSHTPSGGIHIFFRLSDEQKERYRGKLKATVGLESNWSGVDIRTGRSHVVLPGSFIHGDQYTWNKHYHPTKVKLAEPPAWLLKKICGGAEHQRELRQLKPNSDGHKSPAAMPQLAQGTRNPGLIAAANRWVYECKGAILAGTRTEEESRTFVWDKLLEYNQTGTGGNPVKEFELKTIYRSSMKYADRDWASLGKQMTSAIKTVLEIFEGAEVVAVEKL